MIVYPDPKLKTRGCRSHPGMGWLNLSDGKCVAGLSWQTFPECLILEPFIAASQIGSNQEFLISFVYTAHPRESDLEFLFPSEPGRFRRLSSKFFLAHRWHEFLTRENPPSYKHSPTGHLRGNRRGQDSLSAIPQRKSHRG